MHGAEGTRCPVCGVGVFTGLAYVHGPDTSEDADTSEGETGSETELTAESHELLRFSCGHEVVGAPLDEADQDALTVEQRESDESAGADLVDERATRSRRRHPRPRSEKGGS